MPDTSFADGIFRLRYSWDGKETWDDTAKRVAYNVMSAVTDDKDLIDDIYHAISERKFIPGGRFLAQAGRPLHQTNNCFLLRADDSREGWGDLLNKATLALMTGGGIGVDYSELRPNGAKLKRSGGESSGPLPLMKVVNEVGRGVVAGGKRRSAIWAGLRWSHPDALDFIQIKNWSKEVRKLKETDFDFPAAMDMTNVSIILDKDFFEAYDSGDTRAHEIYDAVIERMTKTGEPGFSVDYANKTESLRNACTEIVSEDDSDACCLGSINLGRVINDHELEYLTELGTAFLLAGTVYSDVPYAKVSGVREKNRRIGLGLMGMHEWLIQRNERYAPNELLGRALSVWRDASDKAAKRFSRAWGLNEPIAKRAIAPNGTTSIAGGMTTSGIEPVYSVAFKRRYLTPEGWRHQYVVDFVADRLHEEGIDPDTIEDAYMLSMDVERRIAFQAFVQQYVDNAISSTINLPEFGTPGNDDPQKFGQILYPYLPKLRGITVYPNNARGGQPLTPVPFAYAHKHRGVVFESAEDTCIGGICGI